MEEERVERPKVPRKPRTVSLPPPPEEKCTPEEQEAVVKKLEIKRITGKSLNDNIQQRKDFRNPRYGRVVRLYNGTS